MFSGDSPVGRPPSVDVLWRSLAAALRRWLTVSERIWLNRLGLHHATPEASITAGLSTAVESGSGSPCLPRTPSTAPSLLLPTEPSGVSSRMELRLRRLISRSALQAIELQPDHPPVNWSRPAQLWPTPTRACSKPTPRYTAAGCAAQEFVEAGPSSPSTPRNTCGGRASPDPGRANPRMPERDDDQSAERLCCRSVAFRLPCPLWGPWFPYAGFRELVPVTLRRSVVPSAPTTVVALGSLNGTTLALPVPCRVRVRCALRVARPINPSHCNSSSRCSGPGASA